MRGRGTWRASKRRRRQGFGPIRCAARTALRKALRCAIAKCSAARRRGTRSCCRPTKRSYAPMPIRQKLHEEVVEHKVNVPAAGYSREWYNYMWVESPVLEKNQGLKGKTIGQIAKEQNKRVLDAFLDLVVEENLDTGFIQSENNVDDEAMAKILTYPNAIVGLSDGGAHVQFHGGYGYSTRLLSEWVREKHVLTLEHAVRRLTFDSASALGLYDRGLIRPGMAADIVIFDPDTV